MSAVRLARAATGPQQDPQVRRLLPRPRRRAARRGRLGPRDARHPGLARRAAGDDRRHADGAVQRPRRACATVIERCGDELACIIVEPVPGNMGCVPPAPGLPRGPARRLRRLRRAAGLRRGHDRLPRRARRRAGALRVTPDLTVLGKIVGGGMPAAAFGGRGDLMERLAPLGAVYQAGTLSGNPLAMAAGLATLTRLARPETYEELERTSASLEAGLRRASEGHAVSLNRVGSMLTLFFTPGPVTDYETRTARATSSASARSSAHRSTAASTWRPRSSRRASSRSPTARARSSRSSRRPRRSSTGHDVDHLPSRLGRAGRARARRRARADLRGLPAALRPRARGRPAAASLLAGDEQYAQGLARVAELDDPEAIAVLAELIGLASRGRAEHGAEADDFALWAATARFLPIAADARTTAARCSRSATTTTARGSMRSSPISISPASAQRIGRSPEPDDREPAAVRSSA